MSKREKHKQYLGALADEFFETGDAKRLTDYIVSHSDLPGRRANLELAGAFGDLAEDRADDERERLWKLCTGMAKIAADEAPVNSPEEFIPFCGTIGIGALGSVWTAVFDRALTTLRALASDPRWRMREAVRFGLQKLLARRGRDTLTAFEGWIAGGNLLEMRAAATAVAEPPILEDKDTALWALQLHKDTIARVLQITERKSEDFRILRKALGYTLSVVVCAVPQEGFAFMAHLADSKDADVRWIVKENLKKNRLVRNFAWHVESIKATLR